VGRMASGRTSAAQPSQHRSYMRQRRRCRYSSPRVWGRDPLSIISPVNSSHSITVLKAALVSPTQTREGGGLIRAEPSRPARTRRGGVAASGRGRAAPLDAAAGPSSARCVAEPDHERAASGLASTRVPEPGNHGCLKSADLTRRLEGSARTVWGRESGDATNDPASRPGFRAAAM
jgi:hypothetical protein